MALIVTELEGSRNANAYMRLVNFDEQTIIIMRDDV